MHAITKILLVILLGMLPYSLLAQKKLMFFQTDWGNQLPMDEFLAKVKSDGYDGIEVWMPGSDEARATLKNGLDKYGLKVIFLNGTNKSLPFEQSLRAYEKGLQEIIGWNPVKINNHTGSDFWTEEQNLEFLKIADRLAKASGIPIIHETHRGRFSYTLPAAVSMLEKFPELKYNLDISHWMVVHEKLIQKTDSQLQKIMPSVEHIHARVGFAEGPQVNNPAAPEWKNALKVHLDIWEEIIRNSDDETFTITTEFGPPPYLPTIPFTNKPIADQWEANVFIMKAIQERFAND
ncbi:sugar phosphate isomerase/epimerase family protein [Algoriphagus pacificus]|uniref:Sugar phosphate isomerase/epimerase n=1 Tax=Algoriphagus pacificus TaxID=2811234 RepID=A0ABS3CIY2_9BACT|nr:sugar phosphate isomerase/epimerase [Algoriphagus pacificus]MBN7815604.1 sugar phosphate isomerase/epimerase [Algoriphagus pacificus]